MDLKVMIQQIGETDALRWHLRANLIPAVPHLEDVAMKAINNVRNGLPHENLTLNIHRTLTARIQSKNLVCYLHLEDFCKGETDDLASLANDSYADSCGVCC